MHGPKTPRFTSAADAVRNIRSGSRVLVGSGCAEPQALVRALCEQKDRFLDVELVHLMTLGIADYSHQEFAGHFRHNAFFIGGNTREAVGAGRADYTPIFLSELPDLIRHGRCPLDAALIMLSPPDERGWCSLGIHVDILRAALDSAKLIIAQINPRMPRTYGETLVHLSQVDYAVECDEPLLELPHKRDPDEVEMRIAGHIASLIRNGSCLQLGIGHIPDAVCRFLTDKRHLGLHTEMFSDGVMELFEAGAIDNSRKTLHRGKSVSSFAMGSRKLYDFVDRNPEFEFYPSDHVNSPVNVAANERAVAINSAIQVDMTGQICSDSMGYRLYSGIGGQVDFIRGAAMSKDGRPIIALPSTAKNGTLSRIVPHLDEGAGVVTSRGDAHYVVTEWGIAYLHGSSIRQRAMQLVAIAHPDFRGELLDVMRSRYYVHLDDQAWKQIQSHYPSELERQLEIGDRSVNVRPLRIHDERALQEFFYSHEPDTIVHRYFYMKKELGQAEAAMLCSVDYQRRMALGAFDPESAAPKLLAVARYELDPRTNLAEPAVVVHDEWQGRGLGGSMLDLLREAARKRGIAGFRSQVLATNGPILNYHRHRDHDIQWDEDARVYRILDRFDRSPSLDAGGTSD